MWAKNHVSPALIVYTGKLYNHHCPFPGVFLLPDVPLEPSDEGDDTTSRSNLKDLKGLKVHPVSGLPLARVSHSPNLFYSNGIHMVSIGLHRVPGRHHPTSVSRQESPWLAGCHCLYCVIWPKSVSERQINRADHRTTDDIDARSLVNTPDPGLKLVYCLVCCTRKNNFKVSQSQWFRVQFGPI